MEDSIGERFPMIQTGGSAVVFLRVVLALLVFGAIFTFIQLIFALISGDFLGVLIRFLVELIIGAFAHFSWSVIQSKDNYIELLSDSLVVHFGTSPWPVVSEIPYASATLLDREAAHSRLQQQAAWSKKPHICIRFGRARTRFGKVPWLSGSAVLHLFVAEPDRLRELLAERIGRSGDVTHPA